MSKIAEDIDHPALSKEIFELAIDSGAEECNSEKTYHEIQCSVSEIYNVKKNLEKWKKTQKFRDAPKSVLKTFLSYNLFLTSVLTGNGKTYLTHVSIVPYTLGTSRNTSVKKN